MQRYNHYGQNLDKLVPTIEVIRDALATLTNKTPANVFHNSREKWDDLHVQIYTEGLSNYEPTSDDNSFAIGSHDDYTSSIADHPCLPLYMTGN